VAAQGRLTVQAAMVRGQRSLRNLKLLRSRTKLPQQKLTQDHCRSAPHSAECALRCFEDGGNPSDFGGFGEANTLVR